MPRWRGDIPGEVGTSPEPHSGTQGEAARRGDMTRDA